MYPSIYPSWAHTFDRVYVARRQKIITRSHSFPRTANGQSNGQLPTPPQQQPTQSTAGNTIHKIHSRRRSPWRTLRATARQFLHPLISSLIILPITPQPREWRARINDRYSLAADHSNCVESRCPNLNPSSTYPEYRKSEASTNR